MLLAQVLSELAPSFASFFTPPTNLIATPFHVHVQEHLEAGMAWQQTASLDAVNELPCKIYTMQDVVAPPDVLGKDISDEEVTDMKEGEGNREVTMEIIVESDSGKEQRTSCDATSISSACIAAESHAGAGAGAAGVHEEANCSICLDDFEEGQRQRVLPCGHVFHAPCVDEWLISGTLHHHVPTFCV